MDKESLRQHFRQSRLSMSVAEVSRKSEAILKNLSTTIDLNKYNSVHIYQPIKSLNEVDTLSLINLLRNRPNVILDVQEKSARLSSSDQKYDLIIVPTLAFDARGYRLGWGGGFYDRFLAGQKTALKIGLAYQNGFAENGLPNETHDIALDKIITEQGIISKS